MNYDELVSQITARTGLEPSQAHVAIEGCLCALAEGLSDMQARRVRDRLPPEFAECLRSKGPPQDLSRETIYQRVADREGVRLGLGLEHTEVILQTIYTDADPETRLLLRRDLPQVFTEVEVSRPSYHPPPARPVSVPPPAGRISSSSSLAVGRARSAKPISEAGKN